MSGSDGVADPPAAWRGRRPVADARRKLGWVEVGRGAAALGVVLAHYNRALEQRSPGQSLPGLSLLGGYAVEFFFVLSGFIIYYVHRVDLSRLSACRGSRGGASSASSRPIGWCWSPR